MSWARWVAWLDRREAGTSLALVRIGVALSALLTFEMVLRHGLVAVIWVDAAHGGMREGITGNWLVQALGGPTVPAMTGLAWVGVALGVALLLGAGGRVTAFALLQVTLATTGVNSHTGGSYDQVLSNALWLMVLAPQSRTLSVDCRLRTGRWRDDTPVPSWVRFLIVWQLGLLYGMTGWQKVSSHWVPGGGFSALYFILQQPTWHRFDMSWAAYVYPLTQLATAVTWFWEVLAPLWVLAWWYAETAERPGRVRRFFNRWRVLHVFVGLGVFFHLALFALMDVGPFPWCSLALYPALYGPDVWARWAQRRGVVPAAVRP